MNKKILLLLLFGSCLWAQNKWAVIVGIDDYPQLGSKFPQLTHGINDAKKIIDVLNSAHCRFQKQNIYALLGERASISRIRQLLATRLAHSKPSDLLLFFFIGHGYFSGDFQRLYLLFADSNLGALQSTALSLDQLTELLQNYVPARNIVLGIDARNSTQSLGESWRNVQWYREMEKKSFCIIEASSPLEISNVRKGRGLFSHYFAKSLTNTLADTNNDGIITVGEATKYTCEELLFSGSSQTPLCYGQVDAQLAITNPTTPHLQLIRPQILYADITREIQPGGFIRSPSPLSSISINEKPISFGKLSAKQAQDYGIIYSNYLYWFNALHAITSLDKLVMQITDESGWQSQITIPLVRSYRGWHDEWMPPGLQKAPQKNVYLWNKDQSEMVYIPEGKSLLGIPDAQQQRLLNQIQQLCANLQQQKTQLRNEDLLRRSVLERLEQSNDSMRRIIGKLKTIYRRVTFFDKVNRGLSQKKLDVDPLPPPDATQIEQKFFSLAHDIVRRLYEERRTLALRQQEVKQLLEHLTTLRDNIEYINKIWPLRKQHLPAFYIDRYEISNAQYLKFCTVSKRTLPPHPWWDKEYIFAKPYHPAINISWRDAMAYARWIGKSLPSSAEWEKSARGVASFDFPWGNTAPTQNNVYADVPPALPLSGDLQPPALVPTTVTNQNYGPSSFSCYHLAGNVQEWCADRPIWLSRPNCRIVKGGSFTSSSIMLATWYQFFLSEKSRRCDLGFRCVLRPSD